MKTWSGSQYKYVLCCTSGWTCNKNLGPQKNLLLLEMSPQDYGRKHRTLLKVISNSDELLLVELERRKNQGFFFFWNLFKNDFQ